MMHFREKEEQEAITPEVKSRSVIRRDITDVIAKPDGERIGAPDQYIDTENVNFVPVQSANGAIRAVLF
jgi:hypothetical protein